MPDRMKNTITDAVPGKRLGPPRAKRLDHDVDVKQEHRQRREPSQAVKRQDALLVTRHHYPFLRAFEQSVPLYTLMDLAYILTRKTPKSGGFGGLAHLYVRCPEPRPPAARAPAPALLGLGRLLAADDFVKPPRNPRRILARLGAYRTATPHRTQSRTSAHLQTRPHSQNKPDASEHPQNRTQPHYC